MNSLKILIIFVGALSIFSKILNINSDFFIPSASAYLKNTSNENHVFKKKLHRPI